MREMRVRIWCSNGTCRVVGIKAHLMCNLARFCLQSILFNNIVKVRMEQVYRTCRPYIDQLPEIDAAFSELLREKPHRNEIKRYITKYYLPVAYFHAYKRLNKRLYGEQLYEQATDTAINVITDIHRMLDEGRFKFEGRSRFSTYLIGALTTAIKPKDYIPAYIADMGFTAVRLFYLVFIDAYENETAVELVASETGASSTTQEIRNTLQQMYEILKQKPIYTRLFEQKTTVALDDFDFDIRENLQPEYRDPEYHMTVGMIREKVELIMQHLAPLDARILERLYFSEIPPTQALLAAELKIKSVQYRITQAKQNFIDLGTTYHLFDLYTMYLEKVKAHA